MSKTVEFFYDFTSPTAYLAWARLPQILQRTGAKVVYRPMFLGGVMQTTGNRPPGTVEAKARWMQADLQRWAKRYNTPFVRNPHFPMMTLMVQRAAHGWLGRPDFEKYIATIFKAAWQDGKNIADKEGRRAEDAAGDSLVCRRLQLFLVGRVLGLGEECLR